MKKRARYTNFNFLLLLENYQQQRYLWNVVSREELSQRSVGKAIFILWFAAR